MVDYYIYLINSKLPADLPKKLEDLQTIYSKKYPNWQGGFEITECGDCESGKQIMFDLERLSREQRHEINNALEKLLRDSHVAYELSAAG